jgi:hydrogenase maturation protein HypF
MLAKGLHSPLTSSAGRLFDAVASILGLRQAVTFEGQAAMELEFVIQEDVHETYPFRISDDSPFIVDWAPMILEILVDLQRDLSPGRISAKFHNALVDVILALAQKVGEPKVLLTGGCFQNRYLVERSVQRLSEAGFTPFWHQRIPPNDGGIALGQVVAAGRSKLVMAKLDKNREKENNYVSGHSRKAH